MNEERTRVINDLVSSALFKGQQLPSEERIEFLLSLQSEIALTIGDKSPRNDSWVRLGKDANAAIDPRRSDIPDMVACRG
jgi:sporulation-control protein spo0M